MTPQQTITSTRFTWIYFSSFSTKALDHLLRQAGVVPAQTRKEKLAQALIVWYHGNVPNNTELNRLMGDKED